MTLPLIPHDKANHIIYGLAIYVVGALVVAPVFGLVCSVVAGAAKELVDAAGRGTVDPIDFLVTAAGGGAGFLCTFL